MATSSGGRQCVMRVGAVGNAGPGGGGGRGWCGDGVASGDGILDDGLGGGGESGFRV